MPSVGLFAGAKCPRETPCSRRWQRLEERGERVVEGRERGEERGERVVGREIREKREARERKRWDRERREIGGREERGERVLNN